MVYNFYMTGWFTLPRSPLSQVNIGYLWGFRFDGGVRHKSHDEEFPDGIVHVSIVMETHTNSYFIERNCVFARALI